MGTFSNTLISLYCFSRALPGLVGSLLALFGVCFFFSFFICLPPFFSIRIPLPLHPQTKTSPSVRSGCVGSPPVKMAYFHLRQVFCVHSVPVSVDGVTVESVVRLTSECTAVSWKDAGQAKKAVGHCPILKQQHPSVTSGQRTVKTENNINALGRGWGLRIFFLEKKTLKMLRRKNVLETQPLTILGI